MLLENTNSNSINNNIESNIDNITNQELIDIYKNLKLHYFGNSLSNSYDNYFENYFHKVSNELAIRGIEVILKDNYFDVYYTNFNSLNHIPKSEITNQQTIVANPNSIKSQSKSKSNLKSNSKTNSNPLIKDTKLDSMLLANKNIYQVEGESMRDLGIYSGDFVSCVPFKHKIKNKLLTFEEIGNKINNKLVIAKLFNLVFIKVAEYIPPSKSQNQSIILKSFNPHYFNFKINETTNFKIMGIVNKLTREF